MSTRVRQLIEPSYQVFRQRLQQNRLVMLHPESRLRSVVLSRLLVDPDIRTFYYALDSDDCSLGTFVNGMTRSLAEQHPTFGRHLMLLSQAAYADFDQVMQALLLDVAELSDTPFAIVLDEFDRCDTTDAVQHAIEVLVRHLPDHGHLVINSRSVPRLPWLAMIASRQAAILKDQELMRQGFYGSSVPHEDSPVIEVFALGPGFVLLNGQPVANWEGHLPRLLCFFGLDRPVISRAEICEAFWPELDTDQAVNVFHVTKRRLHRALGMDVLVHNDNYYQFNPEINLYYDAADFVESVSCGRDSANENCYDAYARVVRLYRGAFLQHHTDPWIVERRQSFRLAYLEALQVMAEMSLEKGHPERALWLLHLSLADDFYQHSLHQSVLRLYADLGRHSEAAEHFRKIKSVYEQIPEALVTCYDEIMP